MMDFAQHGVVMTREQEILSTKKRLESFQFRRSIIAPSQSAPISPTQAHARSHSRNGSIVSMPFSSSTNSMISTASEIFSSSSSRPGSTAGGRSRPNSHHRRRSSVSTRAESADMMGVAVLDLPASTMEENVNFGDKDSIRRRALLALEGKSDFSSSRSTVEIPDLSGEGLPQKSHETQKLTLPIMPSFGLTSLNGKRDSFGKYLTPPNSVKDQLHTLLEEEEEEEEEEVQGSFNSVKAEAVSTPIRRPLDAQFTEKSFCDSEADISMLTPDAHANSFGCSDTPDLSITTPSPVPVRHRPANLTLRPLSLSPSVPTLPTPALTPSPRPGLRPLSLTASPDVSNVYSSPENTEQDRKGLLNRQNSLVRPSSPALSGGSRRQQMPSDSLSSIAAGPVTKRQSSISYIRSVNSPSPATIFSTTCLPTPGATPTSERRQSSSSSSDADSVLGRERRNASEEIFIHQSHATLLARITELERALHTRPRSRPASIQSNASFASSEPPDEMLRLVSDLKAERDELNRDIDGWRQRVKDLEYTKSVLTGRLEKERRDNWIKGEQLGILKVEKSVIAEQLKEREQEVSSVSQKLEDAQNQLRQTIQDRDSIKSDLDGMKCQLTECLAAKSDIEVQLASLHTALAAERAYREQLLKQCDASGILSTPGLLRDNESSKRMVFGIQQHGNGLGFRSIDSACTTVDAEEGLPLKTPFTLKSVEEEDEVSEHDDELARYEDEDESDLSISLSSSSFDDDLPRSVSHLKLDVGSAGLQNNSRSMSASPSPSPSPCPTPVPLPAQTTETAGHSKRASLSRAWTFPCGPSLSPRQVTEEVDCFFECLEDYDDKSQSLETTQFMNMDNKSLFSQRLHVTDDDDDDEMPPFILPAQAQSNDDRKDMLEVVTEEDEDEYEGEKVDGGIKFTFVPTTETLGSKASSTSMFDNDTGDSSLSFTFPQLRSPETEAIAAISSSPHATPAKVPFPGSKVFATPTVRAPTNARTSVASRIPPPTPPRFSKPKLATVQSVPPPKRKPVPAVSFSPAPKGSSSFKKTDNYLSQSVGSSGRSSTSANTPSLIPQLKTPSSCSCPPPPLRPGSSNQDVNITTINTGSSRLSFQSFTNFIPLPSLPWSTRSEHSVSKSGLQPHKYPVYVTREKQLSKLRERIASESSNAINPLSSSMPMKSCDRCRSDLIFF